MSVAEKIKTLRKSKGMSQKKLGEELGVKQNTIHSWETGRNEPTIFNCIVLADYFGITLDELCCRK